MKKDVRKVPIKWQEEVKKITRCDDCSFFAEQYGPYNNGNTFQYCGHDKFDDYDPKYCGGKIPDWCPLEDVTNDN